MYTKKMISRESIVLIAILRRVYHTMKEFWVTIFTLFEIVVK